MNIKVPYSWLLEYLDTKAKPEELQKYLSLCGPSVERIEKIAGDSVLDIEITTNRIDCVSIYGIGREAATILNQFGIKAILLPYHVAPMSKSVSNLPLKLVDEKKLFRRMLAVVMDGTQVGPSPDFIKERLEKAGLRSLNNLIDITNYVMLEVGHPVHVFDYDRVKTATLKARLAKKGEVLTTLDYKNYKLVETDVIIEDGSGRIIDLPGIMGTANSVVTDKTKRIIVFIESNDARVIRRTSMRLAVRSMAATINEKDPAAQLAKTAMLKAVELFKKFSKAQVSSQLFDVYPRPQAVNPINISVDFINQRLGVKLDEKEITSILQGLSFTVTSKNSELIVTPPAFRMADVAIPEDIVEEVARIYGYHNLPNNISPMVYIKQPVEIEKLNYWQAKIKYFLKHLGLHEVMNYSMVAKKLLEDFDLKPSDHLRLKNTISEEIEYLRQEIAPSLVKNIKDNEGKREVLRFFEIAKTYSAKVNDLPQEEYKLVLAANTSFADLKGIVDSLLNELNIKDYLGQRAKHPFLQDGTCGQIYHNSDLLGEFGQLKTKYKIKQGLTSEVYLAVFDFEKIAQLAKTVASYKQTSQYAVVKLDLTIEMKPEKTYAKLVGDAYKLAKLLKKVELVGRYKNKLNLRFYFSSYEKNITEEDAKLELESIKKAYK